jgi:hypothetical protein
MNNAGLFQLRHKNGEAIGNITNNVMLAKLFALSGNWQSKKFTDGELNCYIFKLDGCMMISFIGMDIYLCDGFYLKPIGKL